MNSVIIKKIFVVAMVLILFSANSLEAYAAEVKDTTDNYVKTFLAEQDKKVIIYNKAPLFNEKEEVVAILYQLLPAGYLVIEPETCRIVEYSWNIEYPYEENGNNYYNGPLQYYSKENGLFQHKRTGRLVESEQLQELRINNVEWTQNFRSINSALLMSNYAHQNSLATPLRTFNENDDGRCGSVAASILFAYYDDAIDSDMVENYLLSDPTGEIFSDYLKPHLEDIDGASGSTTNELIAGMEWYLLVAGVYNTYEVYSAINGSPITYVNCIGYGRPVIIDLDAHPSYHEHWVVGYGYQYNQLSNENTMFALVNDGLGHNGIYINWGYIGDLVYLNKPD